MQIKERILRYQLENVYNSTQIQQYNDILAKESQYATRCQMESEQENILAVAALISDPVSATLFSGQDKNFPFLLLMVLSNMLLFAVATLQSQMSIRLSVC